MKFLLSEMEITRTDKWFFSVSFACLVVCSALLYREMSAEIQVSSNARVGTIIFKNRRAQRKYERQAVWEEVEQRMPVYNGDTLRTARSSWATVVLDSGARIEMDEVSMIVMNVTENAAEIKLKRGAVRASQSRAGGGKEMQLQASDRTVSTKEGEFTLSRTGEQGLELVVNKGEAALSGRGEKRVVNASERALASDRGIVVKKLLIVPVAPEDRGRFFVRGQSRRMEFVWHGPEDGAFELSEGRLFRTKTVRRVTGNRLVLDVAPGTHYWRITARDSATGQLQIGPVCGFSVIRIAPPQLQAPQEGARFLTADDALPVRFLWDNSEHANGYLLQIYNDPNLRREFSRVRGLSADSIVSLPPGDYYWQVQVVSPFPEASLKSRVARFSVHRQKKIQTPELIEPVSNERISSTFFRKRGVNFSWSDEPGLIGARVQIASDAQFNKQLMNEFRRGNYTTARLELVPGRYYWRIQGAGAKGETTAYSATRAFEVSMNEQIALVVPKDKDEFDLRAARLHGITFAWKRPAAIGKMRLLVASENAFRRPTFSGETPGGRWNVRLSEPGQYFWKVLFEDADGKTDVAQSETRSFRIKELLGKPRAIFPAQGTLLDMSERVRLGFSWREAENADLYTIHLYKIQNEQKRLVLRLATKGSGYQFQDTGKLSVGRFAWSVTASRNTPTGVLTSRSQENYFRIILSKQPEKTELISPEVQFVR